MVDCNCKNKFHAFGFMEMADGSCEEFMADQQRQDDALAAHNVSEEAHADIRELLSEKVDKGAPTEYDLSLSDGWISTTSIARYSKDAFGRVLITGIVRKNSTPFAGEVFATLPEGYRPAQTYMYLTSYTLLSTVTDGTTFFISIAPNGTISINENTPQSILDPYPPGHGFILGTCVFPAA